ncbi:MAG: ATP-binding cassette domain-containing protein [Gammaproteobacteria bacterium]
MAAILRTHDISKNFRGLVANQDISFSLEAGEIRSVIGPNGAGKTTFLSLISGHLAPSAGTIVYQDRDITRLGVIARARLGIVRKFQTPTLFDNLSTYQNVEIAVLGGGCPRRARHRRILEVLEQVRLADQRHKPAYALSHGQRQWLEVGLLIAVQAKLLLLDEPTAGMTAEETAATAKLVRDLAEQSRLAAIIIEHDIHFVRDLGAPITVLHLGRVLMEGDFDSVAANREVREVYLGGA